MNEHILVIDDEYDIRELLSLTIHKMDLRVSIAQNCKQSLTLLKEESFDLILTDMRLPDGTGLDIINFVNSNNLNIPLIMITAFGSVEDATLSLKKGAFDYLTKPINLVKLRQAILNALKTSSVQLNNDYDEDLIGQSFGMLNLKSQLNKIALNKAPVYIQGETGTGKELVAHLIHKKSSRSQKPFVAVNCGAIPSELMESEFFGYKKGSFTGAFIDKIGLFQAADNGTLFLDEIADLSLNMQVKLLRAINEQAIRPIGGQAEISIDVRILSATHKNLMNEVELGNFRQDLYYRLNVIELSIPPLRKRDGDLLLLVNFILGNLNKTNNKNISINESALLVLKRYNFPGNIRELQNILERAYVLCDNNVITENDLNLKIQQQSESNSEIESNLQVNNKYSYEDFQNKLDNFEKELLLKALQRNKWNRTVTSKELGITLRSLRYRMQKLEIDD